MASSLVFPLAGLSELGGQAFKGLLEGEELDRRDRERQQKMQHQGFLERLESERLRMQEAHNRATEQRLNQYLQRGQHLSLGGGRVMQVLPDGSTRIIDAGAAPETPAQKASRELTEAQTVEARRRTEQLGQPKEPGDPIKHSQSLYAQQLRSQGVPEDEIIRRLSGLTPKTPRTLTKEHVDAVAAGAVQDPDLPRASALQLKVSQEADEKRREQRRDKMARDRAIAIATDIAKMNVGIVSRVAGESVRELSKVDHQLELLAQVDDLETRMATAMKTLAKFNVGATSVNSLRQFAAKKGGFDIAFQGQAKPIADALTDVEASNSRYASIAQGLEGVTGNRLTAILAERMRGFHTHPEETWDQNLKRLDQLRAQKRDLRRSLAKYQQEIVARVGTAMQAVPTGANPLGGFLRPPSAAGGLQDEGDE